MIPGFLGNEMYFYSISMTGFIPWNTVKVTFLEMQKNKVFISQEACEGLKISVNAIIKAVQFLLQHEIRYVLTERFSQDPLENYSVVNAAWVRERIILQYVTSDTMPTQFEIRRFFDQCLVMLGVLMKQTLSLRTNQKKQKNN